MTRRGRLRLAVVAWSLTAFALLAILHPATASAQSPASTPELTAYQNYVSSDGCWFCDITGGFIILVDRFAKDAAPQLNNWVVGIVKYVFLIWITIQAMGLMIGLGPGREPGTIFWAIAKKCLILGGCLFFLNAQNFAVYWNWFYNLPLNETFFVVAKVESATGNFGASTAGIPMPGSSCGTLKNPPQISGGSGQPGLDMSTVTAITCRVEKMERLASVGINIGWFAVRHACSGCSGSWNLGKDVAMLMTAMIQALGGLILIVIYAMAALYFAFAVMDVFFRFAFLSSLSPIFVGCYLLDSTRKFTLHAISGLVQSCFQFFGAAMVYGIAIALIAAVPQVVLSDPATTNAMQKAGMTQNLSPTLDNVLSVMTNANLSLSPLDAYWWYLFFGGMTLFATMRKVSAIMQGLFGFSDGRGDLADTAVGAAVAAPIFAMESAKFAITSAGNISRMLGGGGSGNSRRINQRAAQMNPFGIGGGGPPAGLGGPAPSAPFGGPSATPHRPGPSRPSAPSSGASGARTPSASSTASDTATGGSSGRAAALADQAGQIGSGAHDVIKAALSDKQAPQGGGARDGT